MAKATTEPVHTILVAFTVHAPTVELAQQRLMVRLPGGVPDLNHVDSWWIAEDERYDGSDNDSAVFVPKGEQEKWHRKVEDAWGMVPCETCDGTGNSGHDHNPEPCADCWGRGEVIPDEEDE